MEALGWEAKEKERQEDSGREWMGSGTQDLKICTWEGNHIPGTKGWDCPILLPCFLRYGSIARQGHYKDDEKG